VLEERVLAGSAYAAARTSPATKKAREGRKAMPPVIVPFATRQDVTTKPTQHASSEAALRATVNRM